MRHALRPLRAPTAQFSGLFDQQHVMAGCRGLKRRVEAGGAAADHHDPGVQPFLDAGLGHLHLAGLRHAHADLVGRRHLGIFLARRHGPRHPFAQVRAHGLGAVEIELVGHHALRTGGDDRLVHRAVGDVLCNRRDAVGAAEKIMLFADRHAKIAARQCFQRAGVDRLADAAALADIYAGFPVSHCPRPP